MIRTFRDRTTATVFAARGVKGFPANVVRRAADTLRQLHAAMRLDDMVDPPGNRLEALRGDRAGQYSVRINDQWRVCFVWRDGDAWDVEITDYH